MLLLTWSLEGAERAGADLRLSGIKKQLLTGLAGFPPCPAAVILTVESEEEEESESSETEKEDDEGIIFVARATSEVLQEGKVSGNDFLPFSLPCAAGCVLCQFRPLP